MELGAGGAKHRSTIFLKLSLVFSISNSSAIKINDLTAYLKSTQTQLVMIRKQIMIKETQSRHCF